MVLFWPNLVTPIMICFPNMFPNCKIDVNLASSDSTRELEPFLLLAVSLCARPEVVVPTTKPLRQHIIATAVSVLRDNNPSADPSLVQASYLQLLACVVLNALAHQTEECRDEVQFAPGLADWQSKLSKRAVSVSVGCHHACKVCSC